jgi:hypothetical protein
MTSIAARNRLDARTAIVLRPIRADHPPPTAQKGRRKRGRKRGHPQTTASSRKRGHPQTTASSRVSVADRTGIRRMFERAHPTQKGPPTNYRLVPQKGPPTDYRLVPRFRCGPNRHPSHVRKSPSKAHATRYTCVHVPIPFQTKSEPAPRGIAPPLSAFRFSTVFCNIALSASVLLAHTHSGVNLFP